MAQSCCHPRRLNQRQWPQTCYLSSEGPGGPRILPDNTSERTHCSWARRPCFLPSYFANGRKQDILVVYRESCLYPWERSSLGPDGVSGGLRSEHCPHGCMCHFTPLLVRPVKQGTSSPSFLSTRKCKESIPSEMREALEHTSILKHSPTQGAHPRHLRPERTLYMATIQLLLPAGPDMEANKDMSCTTRALEGATIA